MARRLVQQPLFLGRRNQGGSREMTGPEYWSKWVGMEFNWALVSRNYMSAAAKSVVKSIGSAAVGNLAMVTWEHTITCNVRSTSYHPAISNGFTLALIALQQRWNLPGGLYNMPLTPLFPTATAAWWTWSGPSTGGSCLFTSSTIPLATVAEDSGSPTFTYNNLRALRFSGGSYPTKTGDHVFTFTNDDLRTLNPL